MKSEKEKGAKEAPNIGEQKDNGKGSKFSRLPVNVINLQQFDFEKISLNEILVLNLFVVKAQNSKIGNPFKYSYNIAAGEIGLKRNQYATALFELVERGIIELIQGKANERQIKVLFHRLNYDFWGSIVKSSPAYKESRHEVATALHQTILNGTNHITPPPEEIITVEAITEPSEYDVQQIESVIRANNPGLTLDESKIQAQKFCAYYSERDWKYKDGTVIKDFARAAENWNIKRSSGGGGGGGNKSKTAQAEETFNRWAAKNMSKRHPDAATIANSAAEAFFLQHGIEDDKPRNKRRNITLEDAINEAIK